MSVGSAFDAYVKSYLHEKLFGVGDEKHAFENLFASQVESHNRDWARTAGMHVFLEYRKSGALADLVSTLEQANGTPRFEFEVSGVVSSPDGPSVEAVRTQIVGVPLLGKPDLHYILGAGAEIIHDWKVNGYCSKSSPSPMPGYLKLRPGSTMHKGCLPGMVNGVLINIAGNLESYNEEWARQLSVYAWCLGKPVGTEVIATIDQVVCKGGVPDGSAYPDIRIASHKCRIGLEFQRETFRKFERLWARIVSGYFFEDRSRESSDALCLTLDKQARVLYGELSEDEAWLMETARPKW